MDSDVIEIVDRHISLLSVDAINSEIGFRGAPNIINQLIICKGCLPRSDGCIGAHDDNMVNKVDSMLKPIVSKYSWWCDGCMKLLKNQNSDSPYWCLIAEVYLSSRPNRATGKSSHTQADIAAIVGLSRSSYQANVSKGAQFIKQLVDLRSIEAA
ncbi:hypothetical protein [Neptunomonas japonica]|uniref:Uncharacterized protein n=1 Tax=Neptunomonas japonica JAMM 1380 TaxID=1441457 RepID=A0A7R6PGU5_9GAMM|nr:hypothetical protein [Neptunomonas japonica]BBB29363.1 hypothetical protein NEJAP_1411 [Neptunomonas japonica JAMM 1380]